MKAHGDKRVAKARHQVKRMRGINGKAHDLFSSKIYLPLSRLQRLANPSRRPVMVAFYEGMRFRRLAARWGPEEKREWMLERLRFCLRRADQETSYYRELFKRVGFDPMADFSFEDFSKLPLLERETITREGKSLVSSALGPERLLPETTGGSTGVPTQIWIGPEEKGWRESSTESFCRRIGVPAGTRAAYFWGHHLDPVKSDGFKERCYAFATNVRWFDCFRLSSEVLEAYHQEFSRYKPACVLAYSSALGQLAEHILERGYEPNYPTRCFVTGAEKLMPGHREAIQAAFDKRVHERYGARDVGCMGFQMSPSRALDFEVDWANIFVEPETDEPESPILITKLHADGMPMIRYRVGDIGLFAGGSRPGHPAFTLLEVMGRETDGIWLPGGRWIHGIQMPHLMKDYPVQEFMFVQSADYSVELKIVPKNGFGQDSHNQMLKTIAANLPGLALSINLVDEIPRTKANKLRPVVTEVKHVQRKLAS
jgi:phenylacetate-CoA ligase